MSGGRVWLKAACVAVVAAVFPLLFLGCKKSQEGDDDNWPEGEPKVVVSFAPLYCFAVNVAGDDATVKNIMTNVGPHDFNPTDRDIRRLSKADLFFTVGLKLDDNPATKMRDNCGNPNLKLVALGGKLPADRLCEGKCTHDHGADEKHDHGIDPHVWLSPDHAILFTNYIRDELKAADPAHAAGYDARAAAYVKKLEALKAYGLEKLKDKKDRRLVSFHDSLAYFEEAFNLNVRDVLTKKPGQEPDATQMKKLIEICSNPKAPVRVIAVEPQYSTSNAGEMLKKELIAKGVKDPEPVLVELDPLETVPPDQLTPDWYEKKMRANLEALAQAMR